MLKKERLWVLVGVLGIFLALGSKAAAGGLKYENISYGLYGSYAQVGFATLNDTFRDIGEMLGQDFINYLVYTGSSGTVDSQVTETHAGFQAAGDVLYWVNDTVGLGGRLNFIMPGATKLKVIGQGRYNEVYEYNSQLSTYLLSPMLEVSLKNRLAGSAHLDLQVAAGLGWAFGVIDQSLHFVDPFFGYDDRDSLSFKMSGLGFHLLAAANLGWQVSERVSLSLTVGYNYCNIAEMRYEEGYDTDNDGINEIDKNDIFGDSNTQKAYDFDFSGLFYGAGITVEM